jgi:hypothetical protein
VAFSIQNEHFSGLMKNQKFRVSFRLAWKNINMENSAAMGDVKFTFIYLTLRDNEWIQ